MLYVMKKKLFINNTFLSTNLSAICQFTNAYCLLIFLKLYKILHFLLQNCDLKFKLWIKRIHLCAFKNEFGI